MSTLNARLRRIESKLRPPTRATCVVVQPGESVAAAVARCRSSIPAGQRVVVVPAKVRREAVETG